MIGVAVGTQANDGEPLSVTSTSTIWDEAAHELRMYGITPSSLRKSVDARWPAPQRANDCPSHLGVVDDILGWLPGTDLPYGKKGFSVPLPTTRSTGSNRAQSATYATCLPMYRAGVSWPLVTWTGDRLRAQQTDMVVVYKDADVLELPDDAGWLALMVRLRVLQETVDANKRGSGQRTNRSSGASANNRSASGSMNRSGGAAGHRPNGAANRPNPSGQRTGGNNARSASPPPWHLLLPNTSVADIVAFWAPTPNFTGPDVAGPFLVVDSLEYKNNTDIRGWLGVPSAAVIEGGKSLQVYYVNEAPKEPYVDDPEGYSTEGFVRGIATRRVDVSAFLSTVDRDGRAPRASRWTDERRWRHASMVTGELMDDIRVWVADAASDGQGRGVRPLSALYPGGLHVVDPDAVTCDARPDLLFSAQSGKGSEERAGPVEYGVWRSAGIPGGTRLHEVGTNNTFVAVEGRDFVVAAPAKGGRSPDLLTLGKGSGGKVSAAIDPDAVRLPDGTWQLYVGAKDHSALRRFTGDKDDICGDWKSAWNRPSGR